MSGLTFRKNERLSRENDFRDVLRKGQSLKRAPVRILYLRRPEPPAKMAVWVRKKDYKKAVDRNRIRRWVREFLRKNKSRLAYPVSLLIQVHRGETSEIHRELDAALDKILTDAGLFK